jgi:transposase InsO family protein
VQRIQRELIAIFEHWGVPQRIRVDNGRPFGDPQLELVPPLALWLIGLGIPVIWNRPATPQDNAKVERCQGVMGRWTELAKCANLIELKERLHRQADFYNYHFPIRRRGGQKRIELYPGLAHTGQEWDPKAFKLSRVLEFLAQGYWERKVSTNGQISIYAQRLFVGLKYKHQKISIKLDPDTNEWRVFDATGDLIKTHPTPFSEKSIWKLKFS